MKSYILAQKKVIWQEYGNSLAQSLTKLLDGFAKVLEYSPATVWEIVWISGLSYTFAGFLIK